MTAPTAQGVSARMGPEVARSTIAGSAKNLFMAVFVAAAGSAALAAIAAQSLDASPVALVLGVTLAAVAMAAIAYLVAPFHEQTVTLFERGVTMKVRGRTRAVALPGLDRVEFRTYPLYANGVYRGTVRRLRLHSASGTVSIC